MEKNPAVPALDLGKNLKRGPKVYEKVIVKKEFKMELYDKKSMDKLKIEIEDAFTVDLLMIMDCTGSMKKWINRAGDKLVSILQKVKEKAHVKAHIKVAYIGYRDFNDKGQDEDHMDILDYTVNLEAAVLKIKSSVAKGGNGDYCEDV
jgi:hypothetical protein